MDGHEFLFFLFMRRSWSHWSREASWSFNPATHTLRQVFRSDAVVSRSFLLILQARRTRCVPSLYRLSGLPTDLDPFANSPYSSCLGSLVSFIRMTWPSHRRCERLRIFSIETEDVRSRMLYLYVVLKQAQTVAQCKRNNLNKRL